MSIKIAKEPDIPALVKLIDLAYRGKESTQGWTSEAELFISTQRTDASSLLNLMKKPTVTFLKYLSDDGTIEGCVLLNKKDNRLYLGMLSVFPGLQGKGVGKKLLLSAEEHARNSGCNLIFMTVISIRQELIQWYEKHGYQKNGKKAPFPIDEKFGLPKIPLEMVVLEKVIA